MTRLPLDSAQIVVDGRSMEGGALTLELIDDDGEELPGSWSFEWSGRDPLELAIYAVTEVSGRPWKWNARSPGAALLDPDRCRAFSARVGNALRKEARKGTAAAIARVVTHECKRPGQTPPDARAIAEILAGKRDVDWDAGPEETTPAMLRSLRTALKAAAECGAGLRVTWGGD
jgi:hypothetical protein